MGAQEVVGAVKGYLRTAAHRMGFEVTRRTTDGAPSGMDEEALATIRESAPSP